MSKNLKSVIDLGSLKAKLSVFNQTTGELILQKSYLTLLGKGITDNKIIIPESLEKLENALVEIKKELHRYACKEVVFIATESLRVADNKDEVYKIVHKYFPSKDIIILNQDIEGDMFFKVVSRCFPGISITGMDIGGGSVQIFHGLFDISKENHIIHEKHLYKTGTYKLQQKYSPKNDVISNDFEKAIDEIKNDYNQLNIQSDIIVFGSTCMQDFLKESGVRLLYDRPFYRHSFYVTVKELRELLKEIRKFPPDKRMQFYPSGDYFIYGADYLLINLLEAVKRTHARYIYPTNLNSSYGFI